VFVCAFFFQAEDGIRGIGVTGVQTCALPIWVSPAGNVKTGAEFAYRFCIGDHGFIEDHTALSDCVIEVEILRQCFKTKKKIPYGKYNQAPWRIVQRKPVEGDANIHGSITA